MKRGGVLIIEPWLTKSDWINGKTSLHTYDSESLKIARLGFSESRGDLSVMEERYLIAEKGRGIMYIRDST